MVELVGRLLGRLKVPLRAFCWKARGGGGTLSSLSYRSIFSSKVKGFRA